MLPRRIYFVELAQDEALEDDVRRKNTKLFLLGLFLLSNSQRILNDSVRTIDGFKRMT